MYLVRKVDHTREIEALLLRIADPKGNDQGGRLSRATNLEPQLRKMMETRQRAELEEIFRTQTKSKVKRAGKSAGRKSQIAVKAKAGTILKQLAGKRLFAEDDGKKFKAVVRKTGRINFNRQLYNSLSAAGKAARNRPTNGWTFSQIWNHNFAK